MGKCPKCNSFQNRKCWLSPPKAHWFLYRQKWATPHLTYISPLCLLTHLFFLTSCQYVLTDSLPRFSPSLSCCSFHSAVSTELLMGDNLVFLYENRQKIRKQKICRFSLSPGKCRSILAIRGMVWQVVRHSCGNHHQVKPVSSNLDFEVWLWELGFCLIFKTQPQVAFPDYRGPAHMQSQSRVSACSQKQSLVLTPVLVIPTLFP